MDAAITLIVNLWWWHLRKFLFLWSWGGNFIFMGVGSASTQDGLIDYWPYDGETLGYSGLDNHGTVFVIRLS